MTKVLTVFRAANEDGDSSSSSESPPSSQTQRQDEAMNNRRPIPYGRAYSPDELAEEVSAMTQEGVLY